MSGMYMPLLSVFNETNKLAQMVFPEMLRRIIVVNPPLIFSAIFALTKPFLNQRVLDKMIVIPKSDNLCVTCFLPFVKLMRTLDRTHTPYTALE